MDPFERMKRAVRDAINLPGRPVNTAAAGDGGDAAFARGDFADAEALLSQTVAGLKARPGDKRRYAKALLMLATAEWKQEKPAEAVFSPSCSVSSCSRLIPEGVRRKLPASSKMIG